MLHQRSVWLILLVVFCECGSSASFPPNAHNQYQYASPIGPHIIISGDRIEFSDFLSPDDWFPVEINVPDTVMSAWDSVGAAWEFASDYFSMEEQPSTQYQQTSQSHNLSFN